jgi:hypothetical protein
MDCGGYRGYIGLGAESGLRPDGCIEAVHIVVRPPGYPKPSVLTVRIFTPVACVEDVEALPPSNFWPQARSVRSQCR